MWSLTCVLLFYRLVFLDRIGWSWHHLQDLARNTGLSMCVTDVPYWLPRSYASHWDVTVSVMESRDLLTPILQFSFSSNIVSTLWLFLSVRLLSLQYSGSLFIPPKPLVTPNKVLCEVWYLWVWIIYTGCVKILTSPYMRFPEKRSLGF
jgi:hypothetical protein